MRRLLALPLLLALVACGDKGTVSPRAGDTTSPPPPAHAYAADDVVLRVAYEGGFLPTDHAPALPYWVLYGDGRVMTVGPQITIYPGPAYPNLQVTRVSAGTVEWLTTRAREAGVDGEKRDYGQPPVADAANTVFHLSDAKGTVDLSVYALSEGDGAAGYTAEQKANRDRLVAFWKLLTDYPKWPEQPAETAEYEPTAVAVFAGPYVGDPQAGEPQEMVWKGPDPAKGEKHRAGLCTVVSGDTLKPVIGSLRRSTTLTKWTYEGKAYAFRIRPLLPDESGCPA